MRVTRKIHCVMNLYCILHVYVTIYVDNIPNLNCQIYLPRHFLLNSTVSLTVGGVGVSVLGGFTVAQQRGAGTEETM